MSDDDWRPLRLDPQTLQPARLQIHTALQWIARAARAYIPDMPDDAHTSLGWNSAAHRFESRAFKDGGRLSLDIVELTLHLDGEQFALRGRNDTEAREWLGERVAARKLDARLLDRASPYDLPERLPVEGAPYDALRWRNEASELAAWFSNAKLLLDPVRTAAASAKLDASDVRCWPHHFDIATLMSFPSRGGTDYVGAGLSPGDQYYDEPYVYISAYPRPESSALPQAPKHCHWHTHEFTALIVPGHRVLAIGDQRQELDLALKAAVAQAIGLLK